MIKPENFSPSEKNKENLMPLRIIDTRNNYSSYKNKNCLSGYGYYNNDWDNIYDSFGFSKQKQDFGSLGKEYNNGYFSYIALNEDTKEKYFCFDCNSHADIFTLEDLKFLCLDCYVKEYDFNQIQK
jgi:hypothetical protein